MPLSAMSNSTFISHVDIHRSSANVSTFTRHSSPLATTNHLIHRRAAIMGGMHEVRQAPPPPAVTLSALATGAEGSLDGKERCTTQPERFLDFARNDGWPWTQLLHLRSFRARAAAGVEESLV